MRLGDEICSCDVIVPERAIGSKLSVLKTFLPSLSIIGDFKQRLWKGLVR